MTRDPSRSPRPRTPEESDGSDTVDDLSSDDDRVDANNSGVRRRRVLQTAGATAAAGVGAVLMGSEDSPYGPAISSVNAEHGVVPDRKRTAARTVVRFDREQTSVQIIGVLGHGSTRCEQIGVGDAEFSHRTNRLRVVITPVDRDSQPTACTSSLSWSWYRVTIRLVSSLPAVVRVVERGPAKSQNRTVRRRRQARRCRRETFENESVASTAHWTCPDRFIAVDGAANTSDDQ